MMKCLNLGLNLGTLVYRIHMHNCLRRSSVPHLTKSIICFWWVLIRLLLRQGWIWLTVIVLSSCVSWGNPAFDVEARLALHNVSRALHSTTTQYTSELILQHLKMMNRMPDLDQYEHKLLGPKPRGLIVFIISSLVFSLEKKVLGVKVYLICYLILLIQVLSSCQSVSVQYTTKCHL